MTTELTVSVVFTDLVGSMAMASRLGPQAAEELRVQHFAILRAGLEANGGTEVKNLGDGLMVVFNSIGAALDGAIAMQQGIDRHNHGGGEPMHIRIGVSTGDASGEDGDFFGEPVVEAARLCDLCEPGQILTTGMVRVLQRRGSHAFEPVGQFDLKGIPEPVDGYQVVWGPAGPPTRSSETPLPVRIAAPPPVGLCGREVECRALGDLWKAVRGGARKVALLAGEPGIGKTRLATEIARMAHDDGATVLYGRCEEGVAAPYEPFVEALTHLVEHADEQLLADHVTAHGGQLATLLPPVQRRLPGVPESRRSDPETERYLLLGAVTDLIVRASAANPIVLVLDDLHWADRQTVLLLRHVIQSSQPMALLVLATYRDTDLPSTGAMADALADLHREPGVVRLGIHGLEARDVLGFLEGMAGHDLGHDARAVALADVVQRETAGNPFFIAEVMRHLAECGDIVVGDDERWRTAPGVDAEGIGIPDSVRDTVGRRLRRLDSPAMQALTAASVIGRVFDLETLEAVHEASDDELLDILEDAQRAALVEEERDVTGRFHFTSGLIRQAIYDQLSATRQARMHARVAHALEAQFGADPGDRVGELAHHWMAAMQPTGTAKAIEYARRAGDRAVQLLAPDEAVRWYGAALGMLRELGVMQDQHLDLLIGLGCAQRQSGSAEFRETLLEASRMAQSARDPERLVRSVLANNRGMFSSFGTVDEERLAMLEIALAVMDAGDSPERARVLALLAMESVFAGDHEGRRAVSDEAVAIARRVGDVETLAWVLTMRSEAIRLPTTTAERQATMTEARALAAGIDDPSLTYWVNCFSVHPALESGDMEAVERFHATAWELAHAIGQPLLTWHSTCRLSWLSLVKGDPAEAERLAALALKHGDEAGQPDAFEIYGAQLLVIRWHQGRIGELTDLLQVAKTNNPGLPAYAAAHVLSLAEAGSTDEANRLVDEALADRYAVHKADSLWLAGLTVRAMTAIDLERPDAAAVLYELLEPASGKVAATGSSVIGPVDIVLGGCQRTLGNPDAAVRHLEQASSLARRMHSPPFLAWSDVELAQALRARDQPGDAARAVALLIDATTLADRHDCGFALRRARALAVR